MNIHIKTLMFVISVVSLQVIPHGFVESTIVALDDDESSMAIDDVVSQFLMGRAHKVATYKEKSRSWKRKVIQAVAHCQAQVHFELTFVSPNRASSDVIECSPIQQFYRLSDGAWVEAHDLCEGDELLCKKHGSVRLESKKIMHDPATMIKNLMKKQLKEIRWKNRLIGSL